jgi:hypothetical protein
MNPLISVMLPTRKRTNLLEKSLTSLLSLANRPQLIELALAYDDDDAESREYFGSRAWSDLLAKYGCQGFSLQCQRWGYRDLHQYLNELAPRTQGQWLFFWGDDAVMQTQGWDDHVAANKDHRGLLHITTSNFPMQCSILPLFHRSWLDLFGCVSPVNPADSWISNIATRAGARKVIPVSVLHDRFEHTGNNQDATWADKQLAKGWQKAYHTAESEALRADWAQRLRRYRDSL